MAMSLLDGQQVLKSVYDDIDSLRVKSLNSFVTGAYDYIALTYVPSGNGAGEIATVTYKLGGASGTTVATLTLAYDSSNNLSTITKT